MREAFAQEILPTIQRATKQQHIFRWGTTILVGVLAALGLWHWAWLALGVAVFACIIDLGLAIVGGLMTVATAQLPPGNTQPGSSAKAA